MHSAQFAFIGVFQFCVVTIRDCARFQLLNDQAFLNCRSRNSAKTVRDDYAGSVYFPIAGNYASANILDVTETVIKSRDNSSDTFS